MLSGRRSSWQKSTRPHSKAQQTEQNSSLCSRFSLHIAFSTDDILLLISTLVWEAGTFFLLPDTQLGLWMTHTNSVSLSWSGGITAPITLMSGRLAGEKGRCGGTALCCQHHPVDLNGEWWEESVGDWTGFITVLSNQTAVQEVRLFTMSGLHTALFFTEQSSYNFLIF